MPFHSISADGKLIGGSVHEQNRTYLKSKAGSYVPFVYCVINGTPDLILVDTGATFSILKNYYKYLCTMYSATELALTAANGTTINVYGKVEVPIDLGSARFTYAFYIADVTQNILGVDFLMHVNAEIQLATKQLCIGDVIISMDASPYMVLEESRPLAYCPSIVQMEANIDPYAAQAEVTLRRHMWCDINVRNDGQQTDVFQGVDKAVQTDDRYLDVCQHKQANTPHLVGKHLLVHNDGSLAHPQPGIAYAASAPLRETSAPVSCREILTLPSAVKSQDYRIMESAVIPLDQIPVIKQSVLRSRDAQIEHFKSTYPSVFSDTLEFVDHGLVSLHISLNGEYQRPYRYDVHGVYRRPAEERIREMLQQNMIRASSSPYASPIVCVPKKDGRVRLCVDFRALNKVTIPDNYVLPRIDNIKQNITGSVFSALDLKEGFMQVPIAPEDIHKTAMATPWG